MYFNLIYSPYFFFAWAKQENKIPYNSLLVCGSYTKEINGDDGICRFVINQKLSSENQTVEIMTETAAYLSNLNKTTIETELSLLLPEWMQYQTALQQRFDYDKSNKLFQLQNDLIHPIACGLFVVRRMGLLASDLLVYIGSKSTETELGFFCCGDDTQEQVTSFVKQLPRLWDKKASEIITEIQKEWIKQQQSSKNYGFELSDYNFG